MKKALTFSLFCLCFIFAFTPTAEAQNDVQKLITAMLADTPIEENLQELCDQIGGRVTGSEANKKSVEWGVEKFKSAGVQVKKEAFTMPVLWLEKATTATISGAVNFEPQIVAKYQSPPGTYTGKLLYAGKGKPADFEKLGATVRGNFVLVESNLCLDINGLFGEYADAATTEWEAEKYGAKGIVFMASRPAGLLYRFITSKGAANNSPQLVISREDAKRCIRTLEEGKELEISVIIDADVGGEFTSHNVIAEIPGSEKPEEIIVIGAHLDSWALGTGANDNGCNVNIMIDIARQMKKLGIQPKRTIRFALWNGEEQGYFGSWAYTRDHLKEMDNHVMALSVDIGSGAINGFFTNGEEKLIPAVEEVLKPVAALGDFTHLNVPIVGTDNFDFMLQGVGNLVANHLPQVYGLNYHATSDTYDKVDLKQLKVNSAIVAALTLGFANMDAEKITWSRRNRAGIQQIFDDSKLEFTMRMFDVWQPWIQKERGRID